MGRSKFPGKPSKHVNRKRINVLPPSSDPITECGNSMTVETVAENKQVQEETEGNNDGASSSNPINPKVSLRRRLTRKMQTNATKRNLLSKIKAGTVKRTRYSSMKNFKRNNHPKESTNLVGKFVLPTRSVHSSRVIKPNKRFINVDLNDTLTLKKKVNKRIVKPESPSKTSGEPSEPSNKTPPNGRFVLRQARLKLHNQAPKGSEGPFSSSSSSGSPPGTVTCGVCGAVRFYRFVKQARKFNIYSCESCRKFISKLIKRQTCGKNIVSSTLVCHKGQGMCHVPPIVRSQQMKLIRCAYRSRCPACWLKMCLRSFQMPMSLKNTLVQLLPKNMQNSDVIFSNSLPLLWQTNVQNLEHIIKPENEVEVKQRPVRFKNNKPPVVNPPNSDIKRQKIDLKGPRVKHVCRSASIVLGQPLATFPPDGEKKKDKEAVPEKKVDKIEEKDVKVGRKCDLISSENESSDSDKLPKLPLILNENHVISNIRRDKSHRVPFSMVASSYETKSNVDKKQNLQETANMIATDYWEYYDLDDISQNGFSLIASQQFPMPAICFLCGSAGREALLHCSLCCEPYHPFCLEQPPPVSNNNNRQCMWLCPRCTTCHECHQSDRQKVNCQKCSKAYHSECFNKKWTGQDKPSVCSKCLTCKGCGQENATNMVGNLQLCVTCFKQRKKGPFCPICHSCFDDLDINEKMMECTKCNKLIHARCEGLSEEFYHILSILPESVKYLCSACSTYSTPHWRKAVESELKFNFNQILRLLSKNKTAKNMLKLSPFNNHYALAKTVTTVRKIQFSDDESCEVEEPIIEKTIIDDSKKTLSMLDIKSKLNSNEYSSVRDFNKEMEEALSYTLSEELLNIYRMIFQSVFPWFKPSRIDDDLKLDIQSRDYLMKPSSDEDICDQIECVGIDSRYCSFCKSIGDGLSHLESRLLYCGQNEWVHINCALWSSEVYEEIDGSLQNVPSALSRGRMMRCAYCKQRGATVGCCFKSCCETYHFICARTAKCQFMHDKTIYCGTHELPKNTTVIVTPTDFNIRRSVYVEMSDTKKSKFSVIDKINVMVGSLCVTNIGKISPPMSDNVDAIIPTNYVCSRLFWSTLEPWKLVSYKISTSIWNVNVANAYIDRNFTVDHTLPKSVVERKLKEIVLFYKDLDKKKCDLIEFDDEEEPQNGADLLSPEITDAIFEELPHELLDGISVQDIFPKLSYEDFINIDCKSETNTSDRMDADVENSCSLTLSCKLDNAFSPVIKKRKVAPRDNIFFQLLQVDGNFDDSSSSECGSPTGLGDSHVWESEEPVTCARCQSTYRTQASYKRHLDTCEVICSSESDSELNQDPDFNIESVNIVESTMVMKINESIPSPVMLAYESYQNEIHTSVLNTQTFVTSKSTELIVPPTPDLMVQPSIAESEYTVSRSIVNEPIAANQTQFVPLCVNQPLTLPINMEFQSLPMPYSGNMTPIINMATQNQMINNNMLNSVHQNWMKPMKPVFATKPKPKVKTRTIAAKRTHFEDETIIIPQANSMIVQHLPSTNFIPSFVDPFQQNVQQNVQYVTTLAPQPQPLMQLQGDNMISLLPGMQPTMIIQQPRVMENQLILDSNGSLSWAPQPVYYGFETIVQNTVMQSQQFLPSAVPGMLTANSSYSTTTQVFQTSKLEPVLDVTPNSYVLLNPSQIVNPNPVNHVEVNNTPITISPQTEKYSNVHHVTSQQKIASPVANSITLPIAPFVVEQGIPTNIVTPTPKPVPAPTRPMSRVLPMQTVKETKVKIEEKIDFFKDIVVEKPIPVPIITKPPQPVQVQVDIVSNLEKPKITFQIKEEKPVTPPKAKENFKMNGFNNKTSPVQVVPLKPIKSNYAQILTVSDKPNRPEKKPIMELPRVLSQDKKENDSPAILYTVETQDGFKYSSTSVADLWSKVFETVQNARAAHNMPLLPPDSTNIMNSLQILGLKSSGVKYLIEQLPGISKCTKYKATFDFPSKFVEIDDEPMGHASGCGRCAPNVKRAEPNDMFGWLASKHRQPEDSLINSELIPRRGSVNHLPMAMRFRQLKMTSKYSVGVYRSRIHRRGLFCLRDFEAGEMVIEYSGEVIRSILTDKREKLYNSKGIGCYMFRIDDNLVVDATMTGNAARFINHSCDPNCYSKVVEILGHKHIIIFALRKIICGEELTYDYKFPIEEDKIPCSCGARRCRKFLN